ncbi:hypothetical protein K6U06_11795 [Acidiferrimicrobium sp. IK]|uniref:flagellin N-terminal helical domain-containing protein n=1 Tax=Acidiferrimicrobium sp. IK TaxID=2871700 RepID=UPI0021CB6F1E|nr:flagellin [Acidiferrimicrobium sp. IK]MCU4185046.1 hypothetical protein [Acidiferrimicrobium sp. IK]
MSSVTATPVTYTPSVIAQQMISNVNSDEAYQAGLQEQLATGVSINSASDNPAGAAQVLALGASIARSAQYQTNASDGVGWLSTGTSTLNSIINTLQSVQQAAQGASGVALTGGTNALQAIVGQVNSAANEILQLANTTYDGQAIFAGTGNPGQAYDSTGTYVGGGSAPRRTVGPGTQITIGVTGPAVFGSGPTGLLGAGGVLAKLAQDLSTGTPASLTQATTTDLQALGAALDQVTTQAATLGEQYQQAQAFSAQATLANTALQTQLSSTDSTDIAKVTTELNQAQNNFQSGLWAISKLNQTSLVQYLG